jgi:hypothetical protein
VAGSGIKLAVFDFGRGFKTGESGWFVGGFEGSSVIFVYL